MARRLFHTCTTHGRRRVAAWGAAAATATASSISIANIAPKDGLHGRFQASGTSSLVQGLLFPMNAFCHSQSSKEAQIHVENGRIRVTEVKVRSGHSASMSYKFPHLRWEVLPAGNSHTPKPTFHKADQSHTLQASHGRAHREYVFEFLKPPRYNEREFKERQAAVLYHGMPGSEFMFENEYCAAYDFRVPANGGDKHDMHQHICDHVFVMLDLPCSLEVYIPQNADLPAGDRRVHNVQHVGTLDCPDVSKSWRYYEEQGTGGFVNGKPKLGPAVHGVCNPNCQEFREYYIDLK